MINPIWRGRFAIGDVLIPLRRNDPVVSLIHAALTRTAGPRNRAPRGSFHPRPPPLGIAVILAYSAACAFTSADT